MKAKTDPIIAKKTSPTPTEATVKRASRKKLSGSMGSGMRRSHATKAAASRADAAKHPRTRGSVHPRGVASMIP